MMKKDELLQLCKAIVAEGIEKGADAVEVAANFSKNVVSSIQMAQISQVRSTEADEGHGRVPVSGHRAGQGGQSACRYFHGRTEPR